MAHHVVIIGNGIAGVTAARFLRKRTDARVTMISDETDHFYARTALMYIYMGHLAYGDTKPYEDDFWKKNRIELVRDRVEEIDTDARRLRLRAGDPVAYDVLLLATGSKPRMAGFPGEDLAGVQGLYGMPDVRLMEENTKDVQRAVVVGGGLIGVEMAEMLHTRGIPVTFLVREESYFRKALPREESEMVNRVIRDHHVDLRLATGLDAILGDDHGRVRAVRTAGGEEIPCQFVGLTIGVTPNIDVVRKSKIETNRGILVNEYLETNVPNVYAAGDCTEFREDGRGHQRIDQLWYTGRQEGKTVAQVICGDRVSYGAGLYFNSAKFFNLEWQVYGYVDTEDTGTQETLFWQHAQKPVSVRVDYRSEDRCVCGFNLMGVRYRHDVCERWMLEKRKVDEVLDRLGEANFDPEFYGTFEPALVRQYNERHPEQPVRPKRERRLVTRLFNLLP